MNKKPLHVVQNIHFRFKLKKNTEYNKKFKLYKQEKLTGGIENIQKMLTLH
jgi:glutaredoxin-related protein